jgi:hypothetical protein
MDLRSYESLLLFNQGFDQILRALEQLEKLAVPSYENAHDLRVRIEELRADASADFTVTISQKEREEEDRCWTLRREREEKQEGQHEA